MEGEGVGRVVSGKEGGGWHVRGVRGLAGRRVRVLAGWVRVLLADWVRVRLLLAVG